MEIKIEPEEISSILKKQIESYQVTVDMEEVGEVIEAGDGIARIKGLPNVMSAEMLEFPNNIFGMALNLDEDHVGAMILGDFTEIEQGDSVKRTGRVLSVPVGDSLIGRVVNAVGQPVDGRGPISVEKYRLIEGTAPNVDDARPPRCRPCARGSGRCERRGGIGVSRRLIRPEPRDRNPPALPGPARTPCAGKAEASSFPDGAQTA